MKFLIALLGSLLAFAVAQETSCDAKDNLSADEAMCSTETTVLCHDPCLNSSEPLDVTLEECANNVPYCCVSKGKCVLKYNPTISVEVADGKKGLAAALGEDGSRSVAQETSCDAKDNLSAPEAICSKETTILCHDPCLDFFEPLNVTLEECANNVSYCCVIENSPNAWKCVLKYNPTISVEVADGKKGLADLLESALGGDGSRSGNIFGPGPAPFPPSPYNPYGPRPTFCPKFPQTCAIPQGPNIYIALNPPMNIPYCQRIACSSSNPFLERDEHQCITQPGCYFDRELFQYRKLVGQAVLPGVPVCHRVIRNRAFLAHAEQTKTQLNGVWNPLLTQCLLDEYRKDIFGPHVGCQFLDLLSFFGHQGKHAGWQGINQRECALIGACWKKDKCIYPANAQGQPTVRSSNDKPGNRQLSANLFGQPLCAPFDDSTVDKFLSSYHQCLSIGCASNVDRKTLQDKLIEAGRQAFGPSYSPAFHQYLQKVYSGEARPDNYREVIRKLKNPVFPGPFPFPGPGGFPPSGPGGFPPVPPPGPGGFPPIIPFSLQGNSSDGKSFGIGGYPPSGGGSFPGFPPVYPPPRPTFYPPPLPPNQCPYNQQNYRYPGVKPLTGSFSGCCKKPICYLPKTDLYNPYSGISSYLSQWSDWTDCTVSCGGGDQNRTRKYIGGNSCKIPNIQPPIIPGTLTVQTRTCNAHPCPYYDNWGRWTLCSKSCGGGRRTRKRACIGKGKCQGPAEESEPCRIGKCPTFDYTPWSRCNSTCGRGIKTRTRTCTHGGAYGCPPGRRDESPCQHFVGRLVNTCDPSTCCYTTQCQQHNGRPGCCASKRTSLTGTRCYQGQCLYNPYAQCNQAPDSINPFSLDLNG